MQKSEKVNQCGETCERAQLCAACGKEVAPAPVAQGGPVCQAETMRDLPFATVATQQRENERIARIVGRLESIHREQVAKLAAVPSSVAEPVPWTDLLREAELIVKGKPLWSRFIDGTPLANDIAVWMADFAQKNAAPAPVALTPAQQHADELARLLEEVSEQYRHPDYDWPLYLSREVSAVLAKIEATSQEGGAA